MLVISGDWKFPIDAKRSKVWLTARGEWGIKVQCERTDVRTAEGVTESYAPRLTIDHLEFDGHDWRELVGMEVYQHGAWRGEGDPLASLAISQEGEIYESRLRVLGVDGSDLMLELKATCDVFVDDSHDTNVPLTLQAKLPFDGVHFRFRAEGADSRDPVSRARALLSQYLSPESFGPPHIKPLQQPGLFHAHFPPAIDHEPAAATPTGLDLSMSTELRVLHQSGNELLEGMMQLEWLDLDTELTPQLVAAFVEELERSGRGTARATRMVEWLLDRDEVAEVHCTDEQLAELLDKWW